MSIKFRPQLLALEARDVPAAFSFQLPDGTTGHGTFATPDGVDAAQASQALAVNDLTVVIGGVSYPVSPGATAHYANGSLLGVAASGGDTFTMYVTTIEVNGDSAPVAYDAADTRYEFVFSNGMGGTIRFDIPWDEVDDSVASQTVSPIGFNLNIAGQNFTLGSANFTTLPTLQFAYGQIQGVNFVLDTTTAPASRCLRFR